MFEQDIKRFKTLNALAEKGGTVIMGADRDLYIPLGELGQAFALGDRFYNRSARGLTFKTAVEYYDKAVADLSPERVLIHLGENDMETFARRDGTFARLCRELIAHIRKKTPGCAVVLVSHRREEFNEMDRQLAAISATEHCQFGDISHPRIWNPQETRKVMDFIQSMGLVRAAKRPIRDLVKVLFAYDEVPLSQ